MKPVLGAGLTSAAVVIMGLGVQLMLSLPAVSSDDVPRWEYKLGGKSNAVLRQTYYTNWPFKAQEVVIDPEGIYGESLTIITYPAQQVVTQVLYGGTTTNITTNTYYSTTWGPGGGGDPAPFDHFESDSNVTITAGRVVWDGYNVYTCMTTNVALGAGFTPENPVYVGVHMDWVSRAPVITQSAAYLVSDNRAYRRVLYSYWVETVKVTNVVGPVTNIVEVNRPRLLHNINGRKDQVILTAFAP